ncbi:MAG: NUDIX domain-containing protein [Halobacteriales archaeon]
METADVVTCFLRHRGDVLLLRRSDETSTYRGRWAGVSGYVEREDAVDDAYREIQEETGQVDVELLRRGEPFEFVDSDLNTRWRVHPFAFEAASRDVDLNEETVDYEWCSPTEILRRQTVPRLWRSYEAVSPDVEDVASDTESGSLRVAETALEVLRDAAATSHGDAAEVARSLVEARRSMASVVDRVARAADASDVERAAHRAIREMHEDVERAASRAAGALGDRVVTVSRSGSVARALEDADVDIVVLESLPGGEGRGFAGDVGGDVEPDSRAAAVVRDADSVVLGADFVSEDGDVYNKVGSLGVAVAADRFDVDCFCIATSDKVSADEFENEFTWYLGRRVPVFERVPSDLVSVVTEDGVVSDGEIRRLADLHARRLSRLFEE